MGLAVGRRPLAPSWRFETQRTTGCKAQLAILIVGHRKRVLCRIYTQPPPLDIYGPTKCIARPFAAGGTGARGGTASGTAAPAARARTLRLTFRLAVRVRVRVNPAATLSCTRRPAYKTPVHPFWVVLYVSRTRCAAATAQYESDTPPPRIGVALRS